MNIDNLPEVIFFDKFQNYMFHCWREGWKSKKIIENWEGDVSEDYLQEVFSVVVESYWENYL